jgi:hypothetical protein
MQTWTGPPGRRRTTRPRWAQGLLRRLAARPRRGGTSLSPRRRQESSQSASSRPLGLAIRQSRGSSFSRATAHNYSLQRARMPIDACDGRSRRAGERATRDAASRPAARELRLWEAAAAEAGGAPRRRGDERCAGAGGRPVRHGLRRRGYASRLPLAAAAARSRRRTLSASSSFPSGKSRRRRRCSCSWAHCAIRGGEQDASCVRGRTGGVREACGTAAASALLHLEGREAAAAANEPAAAERQGRCVRERGACEARGQSRGAREASAAEVPAARLRAAGKGRRSGRRVAGGRRQRGRSRRREAREQARLAGAAAGAAAGAVCASAVAARASPLSLSIRSRSRLSLTPHSHPPSLKPLTHTPNDRICATSSLHALLIVCFASLALSRLDAAAQREALIALAQLAALRSLSHPRLRCASAFFTSAKPLRLSSRPRLACASARVAWALSAALRSVLGCTPQACLSALGAFGASR